MTASSPSPMGAHMGGAARSSASTPAEIWNSLLRPDVELQPAFCAELAAKMRARKLTFGDRIHSPFLRPFFLDERDDARVRMVAETLAGLGERVVREALADLASADPPMADSPTSIGARGARVHDGDVRVRFHSWAGGESHPASSTRPCRHHVGASAPARRRSPSTRRRWAATRRSAAATSALTRSARSSSCWGCSRDR